MKELHRGGNASYRSEQVISGFPFSLSDTIKPNKRCLMIDKSTDVSVLQQLVIYGCSVVDGKLECHFLGLRDQPDGELQS